LLDVGSAQLNEQNALAGVFSSSGAAQNQADFAANAVAQLQQSLAPLQLQASQTLASPATAGIGSLGFGGERQIADIDIQRQLQNFQAEQSLIPGLLSGTGAAAAGTSFFQPTTGPGKSESALSAASPIISELLTNRNTNDGGGGGGRTDIPTQGGGVLSGNDPVTERQRQGGGGSNKSSGK